MRFDYLVIFLKHIEQKKQKSALILGQNDMENENPQTYMQTHANNIIVRCQPIDF